MAQTIKIANETKLKTAPDTSDYIRKGLKKVFWTTTILILVLVVLAIINSQTSFLSHLAESLMGKLIKQ
ncbi:MAG: hypothetical protein PHE59_02615 [Patescibacteria group bacterium]|nr:hypothetical protein [Patescibacteria group bacterium]MDD5164346.1 hypothetical protein [Patescibacteria group bacterium]MDD5534286.1 hypothetical protein [Patescibacteria group bacterium]